MGRFPSFRGGEGSAPAVTKEGKLLSPRGGVCESRRGEEAQEGAASPKRAWAVRARESGAASRRAQPEKVTWAAVSIRNRCEGRGWRGSDPETRRAPSPNSFPPPLGIPGLAISSHSGLQRAANRIREAGLAQLGALQGCPGFLILFFFLVVVVGGIQPVPLWSS